MTQATAAAMDRHGSALAREVLPAVVFAIVWSREWEAAGMEGGPRRGEGGTLPMHV